MTMNKEATSFMANFEEFKQKAKDTMETIADKSVEIYKVAEEKTKLFAKITKLGAEITLEKGTVRKLYREIGKKYYDLHKFSPEDALAQACTEVTSSLECIAAKQQEIEELRNSNNFGEKDKPTADDDVDVEIIIEVDNDPTEDETEMSSVKPTDFSSEKQTGNMEDVISKDPPEFKI